MSDEPQTSAHPVLRHIAFLGNLGGYVFHLGALLVVLVIGIWSYQLTEWIQGRPWPPISVADALDWAGVPQPGFEQQSLQSFGRELMRAPLSLVLLFGTGIPLYLYSRFCVWLEKHCEPEKAKTGWTEA